MHAVFSWSHEEKAFTSLFPSFKESLAHTLRTFYDSVNLGGHWILKALAFLALLRGLTLLQDGVLANVVPLVSTPAQRMLRYLQGPAHLDL